MDRITTMDTSIMDMDTGAMGKLDLWTEEKRSKNVTLFNVILLISLKKMEMSFEVTCYL